MVMVRYELKTRTFEKNDEQERTVVVTDWRVENVLQQLVQEMRTERASMLGNAPDTGFRGEIEIGIGKKQWTFRMAPNA